MPRTLLRSSKRPDDKTGVTEFGSSGKPVDREKESCKSYPPFGKEGRGGILRRMLHYDKDLKAVSQNLRKSATDAEKYLWLRLRGKQLKGHPFYRQKVLGRYIVDFFCPKARLVIELDGGQHYEEAGREKDLARDKALKGIGLTVLRFSDKEVFENTKAVMEKIWSYL
jgi:very-short-patch-repair endonuclease